MLTTIQIIIFLISIFITLSTGIWELYIVSYYQNSNIILANEFQRYKFTFIVSIMNILNSLYLLYLLLNNYNNKIVLSSVLIIINLIVGVWACALYDNMSNYGRFNQVIIIEFKFYIFKCLISVIFIIYKLIKYVFSRKINSVEYSEILIDTKSLITNSEQ